MISYATMNCHKEVFKIEDIYYTAFCDFFKNTGAIIWNSGRIPFMLGEYENFEGNMEDFVKFKVKEK